MSINDSLDFIVQWHLTEKCNLRCKHCYQTNKQTSELSLSEIASSFEEISGTFNIWKEMYDINFSPSFNITGGEPFLRKDLFDVISLIKGMNYELYLLTNGIFIDKNKAERLYALGVNGVQVSIEGPEKTHDSIRGEHSYAYSIKGIRHLLKAGLTVTLNCTLSALNADYFIELFKLSSDLGVQKLGFSRLVPYGTGKHMLKDMLSSEETRGLYDRIFSMKTNGLKIVTGDPVASLSRTNNSKNDSGNIPIGGCSAGISGITILSDGTLVPCRRLPLPIGNIMKDSLREIWSMSDILNSLRDRNSYKGKCGACNKWAQCRGCRAIAFSYSASNGTGDLHAPDPQCFIN